MKTYTNQGFAAILLRYYVTTANIIYYIRALKIKLIKTQLTTDPYYYYYLSVVSVVSVVKISETLDFHGLIFYYRKTSFYYAVVKSQKIIYTVAYLWS